MFFHQFRVSPSERGQRVKNFQFWSDHIRDKTLRGKFAYVSEKGDWYLQASLPPLPLKDGSVVEHDFEESTEFPHIEKWSEAVSKHQNSVRINNDCVTFLTKNSMVAGKYGIVPKGTIIYCRIEYFPAPTNQRMGEFFVSNVAAYSRENKNLVWPHKETETIDSPSWNIEVNRTKIQEAINKWQVPEHIRVDMCEPSYAAEDQNVLDGWAKWLKKDGINVGENH